MPVPRRSYLLFAALIVAVLFVPSSVAASSRHSLAGLQWRSWWGQSAVDSSGITLWSQAPSAPSETHSSLLTSTGIWGDQTFTFTTTTLRQLRTGSPPNPWEVGWVMFHFRDLRNYYYFLFKPNGFELGKKQGSDQQIFLVTGDLPRLVLQQPARVQIAVQAARIQVWVDGARVVDFRDPRPLPAGSIGLYEVDSLVRFESVVVGAPPVVVVPSDLVVEATSSAGARVSYSASATDDRGGSLPATCTPTSGSTFPLGTSLVTCTATDAAGNVGSASFHVTVRDTTPPTLSGVPSGLSVTAPTAAGATVSYASPTASDVVDGPVSVSCLPAPGSVFPLGTTTVVCAAGDRAGNRASASFPVTVAAPTAPLSGLIWGTTLDNDAGISSSDLAAQVDALGSLPIRPVSRIVMDIGTTPADYAAAVPAIHRVSGIMAELGDSSEVKPVSLSSYTAFVQNLVGAYRSQVDIWEIGNEVNGEWVGTPAQEMARVQAAYDIVKAAGGKTALTLYYNPDCYANAANEMFTWLANKNVPPAMAAGLDYVMISYYPSDCNGYWPTAAVWQSVFDRLHAMFPQAKLAFGESGRSGPSLSPAADVALFDQYVGVEIAGDNYAGGYFWWEWAEDAIPKGNVFWTAFAAAER